MRGATVGVAVSILIMTSGVFARDMPLRRVVLSTGGIGYFERGATDPGDVTPTLTVRRDQLDDVLKSLILSASGPVSVDLPGDRDDTDARDPLFTTETTASLPALLTALRGAEVRVSGPRGVTGRILSVTEEVREAAPGAAAVPRHRVALMTESGVSQFILEDVDSVTPLDADLVARLDRALRGSIAGADIGRRTLTPRPAEGGGRVVGAGYVVAAPVWKTSYRLLLKRGPAGDGRLQTWAIVENRSGEDWRGVDLTLVSGDPVAFRQPLSTPINVERPTVPVEVAGHAPPAVDQRAVGVRAVAAAAAPAPMFAPAPSPTPMPAPMMKAESAPGSASPSDAPSAAVDARSDATSVSFHIATPVTLDDGRSMTMLIQAGEARPERVSLLTLRETSRNPLAAVRLTNGTTTTLPPGAITVYEVSDDGTQTAHVGDARLGTLPAGETRLLAYAVDREVTIDKTREARRVDRGVRIVDGVMSLTVADRETTLHTITGALGADRRVVVEYPIRDGWTVVEPASGLERTGDALRASVDVPAGRTVSLTIVAERPRTERVVLADLPDDRLSAWVEGGTLPPEARAALSEIARSRAAVRDAERDASAVHDERTALIADQARRRDNLAALPKEGDLARETVKRMSDGESRLDKLAADERAAQDRVRKAREALTERLRALKL